MKLFKRLSAVLIGCSLVMGFALTNDSINEKTLTTNEPIVALNQRNAKTIVNDGTREKPYTVDEAIELGKSIQNDQGKDKQEYFIGVVASTPNINTRFNNASFDFKSLTSNAKISTFRVSGLNGAAFTKDTVEVGDTIVLFGRLCKHGSDLQVAHLNNTNAKIISIEKPTFDLTSISLQAQTHEMFVNQSIKVTVNYDSPFVEDAKKGVTFTSSDDTLASVTNDGTVTGLKVCDKVTITATSTYDSSLTSSIDFVVKEVEFAGNYKISYNVDSNISYNSEIKDFNQNLIGFNNVIFDITSTKLFANNKPHIDDLVLGEKNDGSKFTITLKSENYVIGMVKINDAKVSGKDSAHSLTDLTGFKYKVDAKDNSQAKAIYIYPFAKSLTLNTDKRVFFSSLEFNVIKKADAESLVNAYTDAFINLTKDACSSQNITSEVWQRCKLAYANLVSANSEAGDLVKALDITNAAIERYKFCIEKYGTTVCEDYLGKGYTGQNAMVNLDSNQTITLAVIVSIAILAITSIALLVIVKRKKAIKE